MTATLTIRDETPGGEPLQDWVLEVTTERMTVRELIRSRVYQEVQDHNLKSADVFRGMIQPEESEKTLNGWRLRKPRQLDWRKQFDRAMSRSPTRASRASWHGSSRRVLRACEGGEGGTISTFSTPERGRVTLGT